MSVVARRGGFSLVELLTVIAIIAILAAVIFPVMGVVKARANESNCMAQLQQIATGVQMFKQDNRRYPMFLGPQVLRDGSTVLPMESAKNQQSSLFPEYVKGSWRVYHCRTSNEKNTSAPLSYTAGSSGPVETYAYDSYDAFPWSSPGGVVIEPKYVLGWAAQPTDVTSWPPYPSCDPSKDSELLQKEDYARQLRFRNPPSDTVITWCAYHETRHGTDAANWSGRALILFLDGSVDSIPANEVERCMWRTRPKKS